jgi:hypothetical protein
MNQLVGTILELEQHQCRRCGRLFCVNAPERSSLNLDFTCPYGCDDNGRHVQDIRVEMNDMMDMSTDAEELQVRA